MLHLNITTPNNSEFLVVLIVELYHAMNITSGEPFGLRDFILHVISQTLQGAFAPSICLLTSWQQLTNIPINTFAA